MATEGARVRVDDAEFRKLFDRAASEGVDMRALFEDVGAYVVMSTQRRFEAEAGPGAKKWAPFAKSTLRRMSPKRKPPKLLRDRNRLYSSIVAQATGDKALVGTNLAYAALHQFGGDVTQPPRTQTVAFRFAKEGAGRKFDKDGNVVRVGSKLRFAKASTRAKSAWRKDVEYGARTFTVPARPYLGIDEADKWEILAIVAEHAKRAIGAEGAP
ncbi:MAG: phage virion morphogenesis protein [Microbacterium sp.]|nr:MAG: phage virion morphogenesis protein [Microbacterium sp.]